MPNMSPCTMASKSANMGALKRRRSLAKRSNRTTRKAAMKLPVRKLACIMDRTMCAVSVKIRHASKMLLTDPSPQYCCRHPRSEALMSSSVQKRKANTNEMASQNPPSGCGASIEIPMLIALRMIMTPAMTSTTSTIVSVCLPDRPTIFMPAIFTLFKLNLSLVFARFFFSCQMPKTSLSSFSAQLCSWLRRLPYERYVERLAAVLIRGTERREHPIAAISCGVWEPSCPSISMLLSEFLETDTFC
mmetsp:Transcript_108015/g.214583  ORF Transcript_108015/g.214583 Transcript_108015/m.214583 type:complete len:246 (+) Transcript_108015:338-1075(+)